MTGKEIEESGNSLVEQAKSDRAAKKTWFGRLVLFIKQVIDELKKVVTPTRKELINFTAVVLVFVVIMMALVWALDQLFGFLAVLLFGDPAFR
ncbi:preprotein translocase subunit SecE [Leucobacter sp. M11]|uniref:preprotein translocase subunit SecE n=1 Tax=Leucobacter sp. M11 TaxID=2993565 RepID=UPI002D800780|nr:preprotein translocase subunit SecE [Leucobacter sp. M11]MEB4615188.1 preprotein translocase subunit SecE [Leucobacter sp. M11]